MQIHVANDRSELGTVAANKAAAFLQRAISERGQARMIVATGSSQFEVLQALVATPGIDWSRIDAFHLDEYIGIPKTHVASFCGYLRKRFVERVPLRSFQYLDGLLDPLVVCEEVGKKIKELPIDLALVGIGENSHLAFNDPPADFETTQPYLVVALDEACRRQQVGEGWFDDLAEVPTHAISMSIRQIMATRHIICSVPDRRKAKAVAASVEGPVTPMVPASILQQHGSVDLILDQSSASLLDPRFRVRQ